MLWSVNTQYYRVYTEELQTAVAHSDEKYQCKRMSDCPYTGTKVIQKEPWEPWEDWPAEDDGETEESEEEDQAEESDTDT